jgi:cysteinyl-tRNA synthetase
VLWKKAKTGEPSWSSPWGEGRPGWHIECSAMSIRHLGEHFDIHGGGMDLQFPHHENEIAQSEAATCKPFVNYWMHNGFVRVDDEKMSKSLGNFFTVREILKRYRAEEVRYFIIASHYRSPLNYSQENLDNSKAALTRLYTALRGIDPMVANDREAEQYTARFNAAMDDDFNTPEAVAVLFELAREINKSRVGEPERARRLAGRLRELCSVLGILQTEAEVFLRESAAGDGTGSAPSDSEIESLIASRIAARSEKNWTEADRIRKNLEQQGVLLEDSASGTAWRRT